MKKPFTIHEYRTAMIQAKLQNKVWKSLNINPTIRRMELHFGVKK